MIPDVVAIATDLISSPWLYVILFAVSWLDAFAPLIPSEPVIIIAGVFAATGETNLLFVIAAVAAGAAVGDLLPYGVGRAFGPRMLKWLPEGSKRRASYDWLDRELDARGGAVLMSARFIPAGRTLVTLTTGMVSYPFRKYMSWTSASAAVWSTYTVLTGYLGGVFFQDNTLAGIAVGLGIALLTIGATEGVRHLRQRRAAAATAGTSPEERELAAAATR